MPVNPTLRKPWLGHLGQSSTKLSSITRRELLQASVLAVTSLSLQSQTSGSVGGKQDTDGDRLCVAVAANDLGPLKGLLKSGLDPNSSSSGELKTTALQSAAAIGNLAAVEVLLDAGANPRLATGPGMTPLIWATRKGHSSVVRLLLQRGANPNDRLTTTLTDGSWDTALIAAVGTINWKVRLEIVQLLLENCADPNGRGPTGWTALMAAAVRGWKSSEHRQIVKLLLSHGSDPNIRDDHSMTALVYALNLPTQTDFVDSRSLREVVGFLIDAGADPAIADSIGRTPIQMAASFGIKLQARN